jgi:hypothetical protein
VPNTGYFFVSWSDGILTASRTDSSVMVNNSVTATFAINQYTFNYAAGANGTIRGSTTQTIDHGSNTSTVTAVPHTGYTFVSWSDGVLTASRTDNNVMVNNSVTATFALKPYEAWMSRFPAIVKLEDKAHNADPDRDGIANAIEFVIGSDPTKSNAGNPLATIIENSQVTFRFVRVKVAKDAGFASVIQLSDRLLPDSWTEAAPELVTVTDNGSSETVSVTLPMGSVGMRFSRISVDVP